MPKPDPEAASARIVLEGEVADPSNPPPGCPFHPCCPYAIERCRTETPVLQELGRNHFASCHRADEHTLRGID